MPKCVACGKELELPVRTPHTVYVKTPSTASPGRTTAAITSSGPRWPTTSSPRSRPAPSRLVGRTIAVRVVDAALDGVEDGLPETFPVALDVLELVLVGKAMAVGGPVAPDPDGHELVLLWGGGVWVHPPPARSR